jgi:hypothetical protein
MSIRLGSDIVNEIDLGAGEICKAYLGATQVYPKQWNPTDIATKTSWYDCADTDPANIIQSAGSVSQLSDKIGIEHLTQGTGSQQPITGIRTLNGLNVLDFSGVQRMSKSSFSVDTTGNVAVYAVIEIDSASSGAASIWAMDATNGAQFDATGTGVPDFYGELDCNGGNPDNPLIGGPFNGPSNYGAVFDRLGRDTFNAHIDGHLRTNDLSFGVNLDTTQTFRIMTNRSAGGFIDGGFAEAIVTSDVSDDTRWKIEGYLAHKWGLTANLPANHVYKIEPPRVLCPPAWTPFDIVGPASWWDASDTTTITEIGGAVSAISDKLGGDDLVQTSEPAKPITGVRTINGLNVLDCNGSQFLEDTAFNASPTGNGASYIMAELDTINNVNDSVYSFNDNVGGNDFQFQSDNASEFNGALNVSNIGSDISLTGGPFPGPSIYNSNLNFDVSASLPLSFYNAFIDGTQRAVDTAYLAKISSDVHVRIFQNRGGTQSPVGAFGEIIAAEDVTDDTRLKIEGYLAHKWGLTFKLPLNHPHRYTPPLRDVPSTKLFIPTTGGISGSRWYDCGDSSTVIEGLGGVEDIINKAGNSEDLNQPTTTDRPTSGGATINGLPTVTFDAANGEFMQVLDAGLSATQTCFMVGKAIPPFGSNGAAFYSYQDKNGAAEDFSFDAGSTTDFNGRINVSGVGSNVSLTGGPFHDLAIFNTNFRSGSAIYNAFVNGFQRAVDTTYTTDLDGTNQDLKVFVNRGGSAFLAGVMCEFVRYSSYTEGIRTRVEGYLAWKWGLVQQLPSDHPYKLRPPTTAD